MAKGSSRFSPWHSYFSQEVPKQILSFFWSNLVQNAVNGEKPNLFRAANLSLVPVLALFFPVWVTRVHNIIKNVKRRPVPEFVELIIQSVTGRPAPDFLKLTDKMVRSIHCLANGRNKCLNQSQCLDLSSKLSLTVQNIQKLLFHCGFSDSVFRPSLEHLYQVLVKARLLVDDCSDGNWIPTSAFQIQNESAFQGILMDVGFCYHAIYEQAKLIMNDAWNDVEVEDLRGSSAFKPASMKDVDEDREELQERLENLFSTRNSLLLYQVYHFLLVRFSKTHRLAEYLLVKLQCIAQQTLSDGLQLPRRLLCEEECFSSMTWGREVPLGIGAGASGVCKTKWLDLPCAKKCNIPEPYFSREAGILSHVNYPNIIKFICCGEKWEEGQNFIAMELMEMSLSHLIKKKGRRGVPFSYAVAVDIMAQIGRGMCYLHGLRVAHRDLKPANVVLNVLASPHLEDTYHVKLVDFGTSKTEVDPSRTTSTVHGFGTLTHKAPEVRYLAPAKSEGDRKWRAVWFKADVWSFAVVFLEVLSLKLRKWRDAEDEDLKSMFPADCPPALVALLEDCLQVHPRSRPDFLEVCSRLEALRHGLVLQVPSSCEDSQSEMSLDRSHDQFIEMRLEEHFRGQYFGVVADDDEVGGINSEPGPSFRKRKWPGPLGLIPPASDVKQCENQETLRMDKAPFLTATEIRDLEIWTRQPGNEEFRKSLEEWLEERNLMAERLRMTKDQEVVLNNPRSSMFIKWTLILSILLVVSEAIYLRRHFWWFAGCFLLFLEPSLNIWLAAHHQRCFRRKFKAVFIEINKLKVLSNRIVTLNEKRELFSFEDDAKEVDPSRNPPPKLKGLLLYFVQDVSWRLLINIFGIVVLFYSNFENF